MEDINNSQVHKLHPDGAMPPVAVFRDPRVEPAEWDGGLGIDLSAVIGALNGLDGYAAAAERRLAIDRVHAAVSLKVEGLAALASAEDLYMPDPESPVQAYFRTRMGTPSPAQAWWHALRVVRDAFADLLDAPLSGSDLCRLAIALAEMLGQADEPAAGPAPGGESPPPEAHPIAEVWLRRWIVAHQLHAMLNIEAARALAVAAGELRAGTHLPAAESLDRAARLVEGFTAARAQALSVPPSFYEETLRPTMLPPLTDVPLSGRMHLEYRVYRDSLDLVLELIPDSSEQLAATQPSLALARERLLEADLIEAERHVTGIEPLVGGDRSLIQTTKSTDNAISMLRRIRHKRAARAARFVRFADRDAESPGEHAPL